MHCVCGVHIKHKAVDAKSIEHRSPRFYMNFRISERHKSQLIADHYLYVAITLTGGRALLMYGRVRKIAKRAIKLVKSVRLSAWNNSAPIKRTFINFVFEYF
jgi:hypothetical protein